jgi:hypothetical protein
LWNGDGDDRPLGLLEIKAAAAQHGDQFERHDNWARALLTCEHSYQVLQRS